MCEAVHPAPHAMGLHMQAGNAFCRGFTLPGLLAVLAVSLLGLGAAARVWSQDRQRDQERELIRIGSQYALALERYRQLSPGSQRRFPEQLHELVLDRRFVGTMRHLRRLYGDPLEPGSAWQPVRGADGRIVGVRSASARAPLSQGAVDPRGQPLPAATRYSDWVFQARTLP